MSLGDVCVEGLPPQIVACLPSIVSVCVCVCVSKRFFLPFPTLCRTSLVQSVGVACSLSGRSLPPLQPASGSSHIKQSRRRPGEEESVTHPREEKRCMLWINLCLSSLPICSFSFFVTH
ncbi:unnamed protein product [Discosporangium mesarthrocarpum]